jgi:hypothetical protein
MANFKIVEIIMAQNQLTLKKLIEQTFRIQQIYTEGVHTQYHFY